MIRAGVLAAWFSVCHAIGASAQETAVSAPQLVDREARLKIVPRLSYWRPALKGTIHMTDGALDGSGTDVDVEHDLDVNTRSVWQLSADLQWQKSRVRLRYEPLRFRGSAVVDEPFVFHGRTYDRGTRVFSDVDVVSYAASYDHRLLHEQHFDLRAGGGLCFAQLFTRLDANGTGEQRSISEVLPTLGVTGDATLNELSFGAVATFGALGADRQLIDLAVRAGLALAADAQIDLGYRWLQLDFARDASHAHLIAQGPFVALSIAF
ncbi:MAG: hypothetical protein U1E76_00530 [Planctomycetota bacterium]